MRSKRLELLEAVNNHKPSALTKRLEGLKKLKRSTTKSRSASDRKEKQVVTDAVGGGISAVGVVDDPRTDEILTDAVGEILNVDVLENQKSLTKTRRITFVSGRRKLATDAVDERLNTVAPEKPSLSTTKPHNSFVTGQKAKGIGTEAVAVAVDERLNAVALENQRSPATRSSCGIVNGSWANKIMNIAVDARLNAVADHTLVDAGSNSGDEHADILDADGEGDVQIVERQSSPTNSYEDAEDEDADGDSDVQFAEEPLLSTDSVEDPDILYADGNSCMQIGEDQSLTNSEKVAVSSRKRKHDMVQTQVTDPHRESDSANCPGNGQESTSRPSDNRKIIIFDIYGRPCDDGSEQYVTAIGKAVRAHCCPAVESWAKVPNSTKENIWKDVVAKYVVPEAYRPDVLSRAGISLRNWKAQLRLELDKYETVSERKINMPGRMIKKREDWESFVDFCNTEEDRKRRAAGKKAREAMEFVQSTGRKGIYRKIYDLEKQSPTSEVNRSTMFLDTHVSKTSNDPESSSTSDIKLRLIKDLVEANPDGQNDIDNDAVAQVCGRDRKGIVRGMGGGVSRTKVRATATVIETLRKVQKENKLLRAQNAQNHTSTPSNESSPDIQDCTPSHQSASQASKVSNLRARSSLVPPDKSNLPASSHLNLPVVSHVAPLASILPTSSCFVKNFKGRTIALGSFNAAEPPMEHVYSIIIEDIFDRDAELFDPDGKLGDIMIGGVINWPKACVIANLPVDSCFIRNFRRRTVGFGTYSASADPQMEHVYSVVVKEIYDRGAELFDTDGKLGDIMVGGVINWPKACIKPC